MTLTIVLVSIMTAFILTKVKAVALRNNLDSKREKKLVISGVLIILFVITNVTLPYPQSLYWFIALGVIFSGFILSYDVLKKEFRRFKTLEAKDKVINVLFYSLLALVTNIFI